MLILILLFVLFLVSDIEALNSYPNQAYQIMIPNVNCHANFGIVCEL